MQDTNMPVADNAVVDAAVTGKKPLSEAQKAGLAKAREKAREKKLALSKQKADAERNPLKKLSAWQSWLRKQNRSNWLT